MPGTRPTSSGRTGLQSCPTIARAPEAETEEEAEERQRNYEQQRKEYEEEQERRAEVRKQEEERREQEYEAERARKDELQRARAAAFERIVQNAPATFTAAQLRVLLRALVNLDPYTLTDDLAEQIVGEDENEQRTAEEVLLSAIDGLQDDKLTGFALRLALTGHIDIPREGEFDFLTEAEAVLAPPQPKNAASKKAKAKAPKKKLGDERMPNTAARSHNPNWRSLRRYWDSVIWYRSIFAPGIEVGFGFPYVILQIHRPAAPNVF